MTLDEIAAECLRRGWTLNIGPGYMMDAMFGAKVELYPFDPDGDEPGESELVEPEDDGSVDIRKVQAAALRLCQALEPGFG